ncbi:hypothetical protein HAX54_023165, partial [Datura stramonium]|nr:hypothetical protein [Datura stramonium]
RGRSCGVFYSICGSRADLEEASNAVFECICGAAFAPPPQLPYLLAAQLLAALTSGGKSISLALFGNL